MLICLLYIFFGEISVEDFGHFKLSFFFFSCCWALRVVFYKYFSPSMWPVFPFSWYLCFKIYFKKFKWLIYFFFLEIETIFTHLSFFSSLKYDDELSKLYLWGSFFKACSVFFSAVILILPSFKNQYWSISWRISFYLWGSDFCHLGVWREPCFLF